MIHHVNGQENGVIVSLTPEHDSNSDDKDLVDRFTRTVSEQINTAFVEIEDLATELLSKTLTKVRMPTLLKVGALAGAIEEAYIRTACLKFYDVRCDIGQWPVHFVAMDKLSSLSNRMENVVGRLQAVVDVLAKSPVDIGLRFLIEALEKAISDADEVYFPEL